MTFLSRIKTLSVLTTLSNYFSANVKLHKSSSPIACLLLLPQNNNQSLSLPKKTLGTTNDNIFRLEIPISTSRNRKKIKENPPLKSPKLQTKDLSYTEVQKKRVPHRAEISDIGDEGLSGLSIQPTNKPSRTVKTKSEISAIIKPKKKIKKNKTRSFSKEEDALILDYITNYGDNKNTYKKLTELLKVERWWRVKQHYAIILANPLRKKRGWSLLEDEILMKCMLRVSLGKKGQGRKVTFHQKRLCFTY